MNSRHFKYSSHSLPFCLLPFSLFPTAFSTHEPVCPAFAFFLLFLQTPSRATKLQFSGLFRGVGFSILPGTRDIKPVAKHVVAVAKSIVAVARHLVTVAKH
mgnify:CR=1 FL=1